MPPPGGCTFAADPDRRAHEVTIVWRAELLGNLIPLGLGPPGTGPPIRFEPWLWPGRKQAFAIADAWHLVIDTDLGPAPPPRSRAGSAR